MVRGQMVADLQPEGKSTCYARAGLLRPWPVCKTRSHAAPAAAGYFAWVAIGLMIVW